MYVSSVLIVNISCMSHGKRLDSMAGCGCVWFSPTANIPFEIQATKQEMQVLYLSLMTWNLLKHVSVKETQLD